MKMCCRFVLVLFFVVTWLSVYMSVPVRLARVVENHGVNSLRFGRRLLQVIGVANSCPEGFGRLGDYCIPCEEDEGDAEGC